MKYLGGPQALYDIPREQQIEWLAYDAVENGALERDPEIVTAADVLQARG